MTKFGFVGNARRMVLVPCVWHSLDDVQAMLGHIHFDPNTLAHAPGAFRTSVDPSKGIL